MSYGFSEKNVSHEVEKKFSTWRKSEISKFYRAGDARWLPHLKIHGNVRIAGRGFPGLFFRGKICHVINL